MSSVKKRLNYLDVIRVFACFCVMTIHFNASISGYDATGYFMYPNDLIPNNWFGVYLGTLGVGLFYMISGAALEYRYPEGCKLGTFYKKRLLALYPSFWVAFAVSFIYSFFRYHTMPEAPLSHLLVSFAGMDGYFMCLGLPWYEFYQVGEWFLGCILLIYAIYPLVAWLLHRFPIPAIVGMTAWWIVATVLGIDRNWFFIWIYYVFLGMVFMRFIHKAVKPAVLGFAAVLAVASFFWTGMPQPVRDLFLCAIFFILITALCELFEKQVTILSPSLKKISALTYPIFLVHHRLISWVCMSFDVANISKRNNLFLYLVYICASVLLAMALTWLTGKVSAFFSERAKNVRLIAESFTKKQEA